MLTKKIALIFSIIFSLLSANTYAKDNDVITRGFLSAISDTAATVNGVVYILNNSTEYRDLNDNPIDKSAFNVGDFVKAKGRMVNEQLIAKELELEDANDDNGGSTDRIIIRGIIESYSNSAIGLAGEVFIINGQTKFEGIDDLPADPNDFAIGDIVKVKGFYDSNSDLVASEVEKENDISGGGDSNRPGAIRLSCQVPNKKALEEAVKRSIDQALRQVGATNVSVTTTSKIVNKDNTKKVDPTAAAQGLSVIVDLADSNNFVDFAGPISIENCQATLQVRVSVRGFHPLLGNFNKSLQRSVTVNGVFAARSRGRN